jgi:hypothetical protein
VFVVNAGTPFNFSDHAREITLDTSIAELPDDCHGDNVAKVCAGLEDWTVSVTLLQDFATTSIDAFFSALSTSGGAGHTPFSIEVGPSAASVSTTNPRYSGTCILSSYKILGGEHGVNLGAQVTFRPASSLTRRTA